MLSHVVMLSHDVMLSHVVMLSDSEASAIAKHLR